MVKGEPLSAPFFSLYPFLINCRSHSNSYISIKKGKWSRSHRSNRYPTLESFLQPPSLPFESRLQCLHLKTARQAWAAFETRYDGARHRGIKVLKQNFSVTPGFGLIVSSKCSRFSNSRSLQQETSESPHHPEKSPSLLLHTSLPTGDSFDWAQSPLFYDESPSSPLEWISSISRPSPQQVHNT